MLMSNECIEISFVLCDDITLSFFGALFVPCLSLENFRSSFFSPR